MHSLRELKFQRGLLRKGPGISVHLFKIWFSYKFAVSFYPSTTYDGKMHTSLMLACFVTASLSVARGARLFNFFLHLSRNRICSNLRRKLTDQCLKETSLLHFNLKPSEKHSSSSSSFPVIRKAVTCCHTQEGQ